MEKCVILISHSNYKIKSAGVEKFILDEEKLLKKKKIKVLHIFPLIEINKRYEFDCFGINLGGEFKGVYSMKNLNEALYCVKNKYNLEYMAIQLHHLHGWNLDIMLKKLLDVKCFIYFYIHDYDTICEDVLTKDSACKSCISSILYGKTCIKCKYKTKNLKRKESVDKFLKELYPIVKKVVVPSKSVMYNWGEYYPNYKSKIVVREHLKFEGKYKKRIINNKIKIAYIGSMADHKGIVEWKELIEILPKDSYDFYYFGKDNLFIKDVINITVDYREKNSKTMVEQLRTYNIDCVFLWSKCEETYCYTAYEAYAANAYIITSLKSGNITCMVEKYNCGRCFENIDEVKKNLLNINEMKKSIGIYVKKSSSPLNLLTNDDLECFGVEDENNIKFKFIKNCKKNFFISIIYKLFRGNY